MSASILFAVGSKGGVGTTSLAVDIANVFAADGKTVLIDGDLCGRRSHAVLFNAIRLIDEALEDQELAAVNVATNLQLVEIAASVHSGFTVKSAHVERLMATDLAGAQRIIVDSAQPFAAVVRPLAVRAAQFTIVVEPSVLGLTGARAMQLELQSFGVPEAHLSAIIGPARGGKSEVSRGDIERALRLPILGEVPLKNDRRYEKTVRSMVNALAGKQFDSFLSLQPSTSTPLGERRLGKRAPTPEETLQAATALNGAPADNRSVSTSRLRGDLRDRLKFSIHQQLSRRIDFAAMTDALSPDALKIDELRTEIAQIVAEAIAGEDGVGSAEEIAHLRQEIIDEALGLGPLEAILADEAVTEIMVNGAEHIYVEREGRIVRSDRRFADARQLRLVIERIISPIGRHIDEASPMVDARLADGSRVNATIEPLSIDGATLTIRRFGNRHYRIDDLVEFDSLTEAMGDLLRAAVEARLNIVVSGGTGSGKTTLLNVLSTFVPAGERIVTIEDAAELRLSQEHVVRLETRPPNTEGRGEIRIRDLVRNSLRMRPDRIIVGECRGGEALDMLQAMNTGHDGSLTTVHANTPRDCMRRLETMALMAGFEVPMRAIREQISSAVDVVVQTARMRDGSRKVTSISEVVGMQGDVISMQEIARYQQRGLDKENRVVGSFVFSGVRPTFIDRFEEYGVTYDLSRMGEPGVETLVAS